MIRIASFNVENLFARPNAFDPLDWSVGKPVLEAYKEANTIIAKDVYSDADKILLRDLLVTLDIYSINANGAARRKNVVNPRWAWLRKNRGEFDRQPSDATKNVEITATGRNSWIGWLELATEPTDETGVRMTARVISDVDADVIGIVEAEDRPSLVRFNKELLSGLYEHLMLIDGNDERGIDVGIMTKDGFEIEAIRSNVDTKDSQGIVFSRDCPQYAVRAPVGTVIHVLVNHFKSQSGGGGPKRKRQATKVREIVEGLVADGKHVVVLGDLNEGPKSGTTQAENLKKLYDGNSPLLECYTLPNFDLGGRPGTFDSCGLSNRLDYIFISKNLQSSYVGGGVFRKGLWGSRFSRPTSWQTYPEMANGTEQASDHSLVYVDLDL